MKLLMGVLVLGGLVLNTTPLFAQTYGYITTNGNLRVVVADNPTEAITTAYNRAPDSGVMTLSESEAIPITPVDVTTETYAYVTTEGELALQVAETPTEAINMAPDRADNSGVMLVTP